MTIATKIHAFAECPPGVFGIPGEIEGMWRESDLEDGQVVSRKGQRPPSQRPPVPCNAITSSTPSCRARIACAAACDPASVVKYGILS